MASGRSRMSNIIRTPTKDASSETRICDSRLAGSKAISRAVTKAINSPELALAPGTNVPALTRMMMPMATPESASIMGTVTLVRCTMELDIVSTSLTALFIRARSTSSKPKARTTRRPSEVSWMTFKISVRDTISACIVRRTRPRTARTPRTARGPKMRNTPESRAYCQTITATNPAKVSASRTKDVTTMSMIPRADWADCVTRIRMSDDSVASNQAAFCCSNLS